MSEIPYGFQPVASTHYPIQMEAAIAALRLSTVFREFSDEHHNSENIDVVEFRRLRDIALNRSK